jgi:hypothetical protein
MFSLTFTGFVSGLENEVEYSQETRCEHFRLDLVDYFSLVMERVKLKYGNGIPRHCERLKQPLKFWL